MKTLFKKMMLLQCFFLLVTSISCAAHRKDQIFEVTGIREQDARIFYSALKDAILNNKREVLAGMVRYPVGAFVKGKPTANRNRIEFLKNYDEIINQHIKDVVKKTKFEDLKPNFRGLFVGDGEMILSGFIGEDGIFIIVFNNQMK